MILSNSYSYDRGQIGLVVLLIMAVLLTVGIGVASESVVGQKTSRQEVESTETLNVAEGGVEEALSQDLSGLPVGVTSPISVTESSSWDGTLSVTATARDTFRKRLNLGESGEIRLNPAVNHQLVVNWSRPEAPQCVVGNANSTPAVIVTLFNSAGDTLKRYAYGPNADCTRSDGFLSGSWNGTTYQTAVIDTSGFSMARVKAIYNSSTVTVSGVSLAAQMQEIVSTASKTSGETRSVQVDKGLPVTPSIFDYAVFAGLGGIAISN